MKHNFVFLILFLLVTQAWAGTRFYDFSDERQFADWHKTASWTGADDGEPYESEWFVENGELVSISKDACGKATGVQIGDETWRNYDFEFQFKIEQSFPALCGDDWPQTFFAVLYWRSFGNETDLRNSSIWFGPTLVSWAPNWTVVIWGEGAEITNMHTMNPGLKENEWYTARIVTEGNFHRMFIGDERIVEREVSSAPGTNGVAALRARNLEIHFDNVTITGDSIPDAVTAVSPQGKLAMAWGKIKGF